MLYLQLRSFFWSFFLFISLLPFLSTAYAQTGQLSWADTLVAKSLLEESKQLNKQDKSEAALEKAQKALAIYVDLYGEDHLKAARPRMYVARELKNLRRDEEAAALLQHSLRIFETTRDTIQTAICHNLLCMCRRNQRRYAEARQHIQSAIGLLRPDSTRHASHIADFKITLSDVFNKEKNFLAVIPLLEESKSVHTANKDSSALGNVCYHLGDAYFGLHDYVRAKENYLAASAYLQGKLQPDDHDFVDLLVNIGLCCQKTGDAATALAHLLQAKEVYLKSGEESLNYIGHLQDLGQFYLDEHQYLLATEQFEVCLAAKEKHFGTQSHYLLSSLRSLGEARAATREFAQAEASFRRAMSIAGGLPGGGWKFTYLVYSDLAKLRLAQGDYAGSLLLCDTALVAAGFDPAHPEKSTPRDAFRELCQTAAQALVQQYRLSADTALLFRAERYFALAAKTLYQEITEVTVNSSREVFYDRDHTVLEQWLDTRMMLFAATGNVEHAEAAFQIADQGKAFLLAEAMRQSGALRYAGVPDSVVQVEWSLRARISAAEKQLDYAGPSTAAHTDSSTQALSRDVSAWRADYDALLRRIERDYPEYFRLRLLQRNIPTLELRKKWLAPDQTLLMYSLTETHAYAFVLTCDTFRTLVLPTDTALATEVAALRKSLIGYYTAAAPDDAQYDRDLDTYIVVAQSLYQKLVQPVAHLLTGRVVVIPEGPLCYLPFEALLAGVPKDAGNFRTYPFWIREKALSYAHSTEYWVETAAPPPLKAEKTWLGLAPFSQGQAASDVAFTTVRQENFSPLPFSGKEVTDIAGLLQGEAWLGAAASSGRFEKVAARYRLLHLATHSRADDRLGHYSYIATSNTDKLLYAKDLYLLSLAAEMVVLSSCEAGGGKLLRGEGIIGMVRAFAYAGARSVVAPLWVANDQSTASLMTDFYRNLSKGRSKDVALQQAYMALLDGSPAESHPFFWAGFRVFGQAGALWR